MLPLLLLVCLLVICVQTQESLNEPIVCDCGFQDENELTWANVWHADFNTYNSKLQQDENYVVMDYTVGPKHGDTYERTFRRDNVDVSDGSAQLVVRDDNGKPTSASFGTKRQDILYGSFRINMKIPPVSGTVSAFFFYRNNTCEIDIETLSRIQNPWQSYFSIQPQVYEDNGEASPVTHATQALPFNPTEDYHEYRFDWVPGSISYYVDSVLSKTLTTNVPESPGRMIVNHWSDGNPNFSGGPPTEDAILSIANITMFFNSSEPTGALACHATQEPCKASDIMDRKVLPSPETSNTSTSSPETSNTNTSSPDTSVPSATSPGTSSPVASPESTPSAPSPDTSGPDTPSSDTSSTDTSSDTTAQPVTSVSSTLQLKSWISLALASAILAILSNLC